MDTKHYWTEQIAQLTEKIRQDHPELIRFIDEMPITIPDEINPRITVSALKDFYETLLNIEHAGEHLSTRIYTR